MSTLPALFSRGRIIATFGALALAALITLGSSVVRIDPGPHPEEFGYHGALRWVSIEDLPKPIALFESVFWDPRDTPSLRRLLRKSETAKGRRVFELGTGSGLLALCALQAGATNVVATDINANAVLNARFNGATLGFGGRLEVRKVTLERPGAFAVIGADEQFDVILSNPPWVDREPQTVAEFALYDSFFNLLRSLLDGLPQHLRPGGRVFLAYGCVDGIRTLQSECAKRGYRVRVVDDDRDLDKLPEEFLPGMLLEVQLPRAGS